MPKILPKCKKYRNQNEALKGIRSLLKTKSHWCQGYSALNAEGFFRDSQSDDVVRVCLVGACNRLICDNEPLLTDVFRTLDTLAVDLYGVGAVGVNDGRGYAAVLELLDAAVATTTKGHS